MDFVERRRRNIIDNCTARRLNDTERNGGNCGFKSIQQAFRQKIPKNRNQSRNKGHKRSGFIQQSVGAFRPLAGIDQRERQGVARFDDCRKRRPKRRTRKHIRRKTADSRRRDCIRQGQYARRQVYHTVAEMQVPVVNACVEFDKRRHYGNQRRKHRSNDQIIQLFVTV